MSAIEMYTLIVGVVVLKILIRDNITFFMACAFLGVALGIHSGLSK